ncbi:MAG: hypothetical protein Q8O70_05270, partial [Burkholderiales bacterium]|nr:hypothetical protein [Burkholderiales bacterium]
VLQLPSHATTVPNPLFPLVPDSYVVNKARATGSIVTRRRQFGAFELQAADLSGISLSPGDDTVI